jgi:hypothetical protein
MTEQMESERKIEKLLRAYAKKRRAEAGDPLKLHPTTRRLLQDQVSRNTPKPDEEDASMSLWELFRQRWPFLLSFAFIVFFVATMFLPALSPAKKKAQTVTAMNNLKQIGVAAQMAAEESNGKLPESLDALTNQFVSEKILTDTESGKRFIYVAGGKNLDDLSSNSVLAYSPTDNKGRAVLLADGHVEVVNGARFSELTNRGLPELAVAKDSMQRQLAETPATITGPNGNAIPAPSFLGQLKSTDSGKTVQNTSELAANIPSAPATTFDRRLATTRGTAGNYNSTAQTNSVQLASAALNKFSPAGTFGLQNLFKNTAVPAKTVLVLSNFEVQQNGNAIRVEDADGSVYDGSLQMENAVAQNTPTPPATTPVQVERTKIITIRSQVQSLQNYFFRVSGTNQTLKQNVVFTGNLLAISNTTTNLQQSFSVSDGLGGGGFGGGQSQSVFTNQLPWSNSRIAGTAVIADTNNIEINAVPMSP